MSVSNTISTLYSIPCYHCHLVHVAIMQLNKLTTRSTAGQRSRRSFRAFASAAPVSTPAPVKMDAAAKARARASILGGLVADAATMPLHWIYDVRNQMCQCQCFPQALDALCRLVLACYA